MTRNIAFNFLSLISSVALAFVVSPMILRSLGDERYGIWALFAELLIYFGLMDFGIRGSVNYFVGKAISVGDKRDIGRYTSSAFSALVVLGSVGFSIAVALIFIFEKRLLGNYPDRFDVVGSAIVFSLLFCFGLPMEIFSASLVGGRQAFLVSSTDIVARTIGALLMIVGLKLRPSLMVLCLAQVVSRIFYWIVVRHHVRRKLPDVHIDLKLASLTTVRELMSYGAHNSVIDVASVIGGRKDVTLTTIFLGSALVPTYSFARQFLMIIAMACASITRAVRPNMLYHWVRDEKTQTYEIYYTILRYSSFVVFMAAAFLFSFGPDFISLWIGSRFVTGNPLFRTDYILFIMLTSYIPRSLHSISWQFLYATNKQRALTALTVAESVVNFGLSLLLVRTYGTLGLAIANAVPGLISSILIMPVMMHRLVGVSYRRYILDGVGPSALVCGSVFLLGVFLRRLSPSPSWMFLVQAGLVMSLTGFILGYVFLLRKPHREKVVSVVRARLPKAA